MDTDSETKTLSRNKSSESKDWDSDQELRKDIDGTPGLSIDTKKFRTWKPIVARTRNKHLRTASPQVGVCPSANNKNLGKNLCGFVVRSIARSSTVLTQGYQAVWSIHIDKCRIVLL